MKFWRGFKKRRLRKKINQLSRLLGAIDKIMKSLGYSRQRRRQAWRDFIKSPENRAAIINLFSEILSK